MQRLLIAFASGLALAAGGAALAQEHSAHAGDHAAAVQTTPADGAMGGAPQSFTATFPHPMTLTGLSLVRDGGAPSSVPVAPAAPTATVSVALPAMPAGNYVIAWSAASADGRSMNGVIRYMVH